MPQSKLEAAGRYCDAFRTSTNLEASGVHFTFSRVSKHGQSITLGLRHIAADSREVAAVDIPLSQFETVSAIYKRGKGWGAKVSDFEAMRRLFREYPPASYALASAVRHTAAAAAPLPSSPAPSAVVPALSEQTMSLDVRAPSVTTREQLVEAATQTLGQMTDEEEEVTDEQLDEVAEQVYGPIDESQSHKDLTKARDKRRRAAAKAFQEAWRRRQHAAVIRPAPAAAALIPRITAADVASTHALLYDLATSLPQQEQADALREIADAGTDLVALTRVGKSLLDKRARLAQQRVEVAEARKPKAKSRKQVMKMVRKLRVSEPEPASGLPSTLHLTSEQAERLRDQLNAAYDAASGKRPKGRGKAKRAESNEDTDGSGPPTDPDYDTPSELDLDVISAYDSPHQPLYAIKLVAERHKREKRRRRKYMTQKEHDLTVSLLADLLIEADPYQRRSGLKDIRYAYDSDIADSVKAKLSQAKSS